MKIVGASEARKRWFELLDSVLAGEAVTIRRKGRRIVLRAEDAQPFEDGEIPDYSSVLTGDGIDDADRWGWEWSPEDVRLIDL